MITTTLSEKSISQRLNAAKDRLSILVLDEFGPTTLSVLRCFGQVTGIRSHVIAREWLPARYSRYCDSFHIIPPELSETEFLEEMLETARQKKVDIIFPTSSDTTVYLSKYRDQIIPEFALPPLPDLDTFDTANNKGKLARFLDKEGFCHPSTYYFDQEVLNEEDLRNFPFPAVLKVHIGVGGYHIFKVNDVEDIKRTVREHQLNLSDFILQEYIREGCDISFSALCKEGKLLAYTIWKEVNCVDPEKKAFKSIVDLLDYYHSEQLKTEMERLFAKLKWNGLANVNLRYRPREKTNEILEINPRIWNSLLGSLFAGVNFPYLACLAGLGIEFEAPPYRDDHFFMKHLFSGKKHRKGLGMPYEISKSMSIYLFKDPIPSVMAVLQRLSWRHLLDHNRNRDS